MEYNYASLARKLLVGIATIALVGYACFCDDISRCDVTDASAYPSPAQCPNYGNCVENVIAKLRDETPDKEGFLHTGVSYPSYAYLAVTGNASCSPMTGTEACRSCLKAAKTVLDGCKWSVSGIISNEECTMWFAEILESV